MKKKMLMFSVLILVGSLLVGCEKGKEKEEDEPIKIYDNGGVAFEVKGTRHNNQLYVNGKLFDKLDFNSYNEEKIYKIGDDLLLVEACDSSCNEYFVNADGEIVGRFSITENSDAEVLVTPKYASSKDNFYVKTVTGNDLYVESYKYSYNNLLSICEYSPEEEVSVTEKFTYQGDKVFSEGEVIESSTRDEVIQSDERFYCEH